MTRPPFIEPATDDSSLFETCAECDGWGGWTETAVDHYGREVDLDTLCEKCGGSGRL